MIVTTESWVHRIVPASGTIYAPKDWAGKKVMAVTNVEEFTVSVNLSSPKYTVEFVNGAVMTTTLPREPSRSIPVMVGPPFAGSDVLLLLAPVVIEDDSPDKDLYR